MPTMTTRTLLLAMLLLSLPFGTAADNLGFSKSRPLLFGIDVDYAPLEYVDAEGMPQGLDIKFTQELLKRLNIPYTYSPNTWQNISGDVLSGRVDLGMMVYSTYRKDLTNYSRQVFRLYYQIVFRSEDKKSRRFDMRNFTGKNIAFMSSRPLKDTLVKAGAIPTIVSDLPKAMRNLSAGKYDAVICFRYQAKYLIKRFALNNLQTQDMTLQPREYCYVSPNKQLIEAINTELDKMEADGTILDIYGDEVTSQFGSLEIPSWLWWLIGVSAAAFLLVFIVAQHRYQQRLKYEIARAQRSDQLKSVFLGNVSHALRTPLNAIIGFSDIMVADDQLTDADRQQMAQLINTNGHQLLYFIDELLQLSHIEGNDMHYNRRDVDLRQAMEAMAEVTRGKVAPGVEVRVEGDGGTVFLDDSVMQLVTMHCLNNAAKYTKHGSITLRYGSRDGGLLIEVADTGPGLPEELRENIFALLTAKDTYVQKEVPGLGLSICKAIVDRRGGRIGATSPPGGGTVLWHWVPVKVRP